MELTKFTEKTTPLAITFDDQTLKVRYRPNAIRLKDMERATDTTAEEAADLVCRVIAEWDLVQDGQPVALLPAVVVGLPATLLLRVVDAAAEDVQVPPTSASS